MKLLEKIKNLFRKKNKVVEKGIEEIVHPIFKPGTVIEVAENKGPFLDSRIRYKFKKKMHEYPEEFTIRLGNQKEWLVTCGTHHRFEKLDILVKNGNNRGVTVLVDGKYSNDKLTMIA